MLQELIDDDNMSSLSSLTELSEEDALPQLVSDARRVSQAAAVIQGTPKRILRKSTQVPHPKTALLKTNIRDRKLCLAKIQKRLIVNVNHDLKYWEEQAPVFRLAGIKLCELKARPKNTAKDKARAQEVMEEMKSWESDGSSGVFQDELGNTLVAYFGRRAGTNIKVCGYLRPTTGITDRSPETQGVRKLQSRTQNSFGYGAIPSVSGQGGEGG